MLQITSDAEPGWSEPLLLLAMFSEQVGIDVFDSLAVRLSAISEANPVGITRAFMNHGLALLELNREARVELLKKAIGDYAKRADQRTKNQKQDDYAFLQVEFAWARACITLRKSGCRDWERFQKRYERVHQRYHASWC
jgi:hypothetical protein